MLDVKAGFERCVYPNLHTNYPPISPQHLIQTCSKELASDEATAANQEKRPEHQEGDENETEPKTVEKKLAFVEPQPSKSAGAMENRESRMLRARIFLRALGASDS